MESNQAALAVVDAAFADLERKIAALDELTDKLQSSRERLSDIDKEISTIKTDADSLERTKRISRLTTLNSTREIAGIDRAIKRATAPYSSVCTGVWLKRSRVL